MILRKSGMFAVFAMLLCCTGALFAQTGSGQIAGQVTKKGKGIAGVTVVINENKMVQITDLDGKFTFQKLPVGTYTVLFTLEGNTETRPGTVVEVGETTQLDLPVDWDIGLQMSMTVYSASRRAEKIVDAPASITVINTDQIEREASHGQLPKVLEFTPGAEVTQSGVYDFNFNTRGFNSSLNRRVAAYIDGRDVSAVFLGAQEWSALTVPLDDMASIEFIRGPSAALYGANASSGVINMTTRPPRDSAGGLVRVSGGELDTQNVDMRWAGELDKGWFLKVQAGTRLSGDFSVSRDVDVEYSKPCEDVGEANCLPIEAIPIKPDNEIFFGGARFDKYFGSAGVLTIDTGYADISGPEALTGIGRVKILNARRPWTRLNVNLPHWNFLGSFARREGDQVSLASGNPLVLKDTRFALEVQTNWNFGGEKGRVVGGAAYTHESVDSLNSSTGEQTLLFQPAGSDRYAVFGQADWRFNKIVKAVVAGRVDDSTLHDLQFSPKAALVLNLTPEHTLRLTYNEAFQVANYSEFFLRTAVGEDVDLRPLHNAVCVANGLDCGLGVDVTPFALGNPDLKQEETTSWEIGYNAVLGKKAFLTVDYYEATNRNFITDLRRQCQRPSPTFGPACADLLPSELTNPNFTPWRGSDVVENTFLIPGLLTYGQAMRNAFAVAGGDNGGVVLSQAEDGTPIIAAVSYGQFGRVDTRGYDIGLTWFMKDPWSLQASLGWFGFDVVSVRAQGRGGDPNDDLLPNTPPLKWGLGLTRRGKRLDVGYNMRWVHDFEWSAGLYQGPVPSYITADMNANWKINDSFQIGMNVTNLFDLKHYQAFGGTILGRRALAHVVAYW